MIPVEKKRGTKAATKTAKRRSTRKRTAKGATPMRITIRRVRRKRVPDLAYSVLLAPLPADEGGGYLATVPDLPGCMSDGPSIETALESVHSAIAEWIEEARRMGRSVPEPRSVIED